MAYNIKAKKGGSIPLPPRMTPAGRNPATPEEIGAAISAELIPFLNGIRQAIQAINIQVPTVNVPAPVVHLPAPVVNVPEQRITFPESISTHDRTLSDVDRKRPLPVIMMDQGGQPMMFSQGASGGKADFFTIKDIRGSTASLIDQVEGALKVTGAFASSLNVDYGSGPVGSATLRVVHATDVGMSVSVTDVGNSALTGYVNGDGRIRVSVETGGSGLTDAELRASRLDVIQVSGSNWSVVATGAGASFFSEILNADGRVKVSTQGETLIVDQLSGSQWSTVVNNTIDAKQLSGSMDSTNIVQLGGNAISLGQGVDAAGVQRIVHVVDVALSTNAATALDYTIDSISVFQVSGANFSVFVTGSADSMGAWEARTTNPTAKADGADVRPKTDDLGRTLTRPVQVRDLIKTAYVSVTNGTETTLLAAVAGAFLDCVMLVGSNNSDAAVSIDIRAVTAGNIVHTLRIPANGTAGWAPTVPWPQDATGNNWTVDAPDQTGCTYTFSALFSQEV